MAKRRHASWAHRGPAVALLAAGVGLAASSAFAAFPTFYVTTPSATPGATPLVPSNTPGPSNEVTTVLRLRDDNASSSNATSITFGSTLPAGAMFVGQPTFTYEGGSPNTIGSCAFSPTSFSCTGGFLGAFGNNIVFTSVITLTPAYTGTTFTEPFDTATFNGPGPGTLEVTGVPPVSVAQGTPTCVVTAVRRPGSSGSAEQDVTVSAPSGIASIGNVLISNGQVFTGGSSGTQIDPAGVSTPGHPTSLVLTAVKTAPGIGTVWSFDVTDVAGNTTHCA